MSKKKVLILSYFFPPCNLPASQRSYGWATQLHEYGYHPIIITRNWSLERQRENIKECRTIYTY